MAELLVLNPYGLAEGTPCHNIRITYLGPEGQAKGWDGVLSILYGVGRNWEDIATDAFLNAKQSGGLEAGMMAYCRFCYLDDDTEQWVQFM